MGAGQYPQYTRARQKKLLVACNNGVRAQRTSHNISTLEYLTFGFVVIIMMLTTTRNSQIQMFWDPLWNPRLHSFVQDNFNHLCNTNCTTRIMFVIVAIMLMVILIIKIVMCSFWSTQGGTAPEFLNILFFFEILGVCLPKNQMSPNAKSKTQIQQQ